MHHYHPIQLTFGSYGHTLHHCQVISPSNEWIVYDTRNEDSAIGTTTRIERVNIHTHVIEVLYEVEKHNEYGPGVGAVTYAPNKETVLFIHGLLNASQEKPYAMDRRSGVGIHTEYPQQLFHVDARCVQFPFHPGALRGGTHSHYWHPNGELISFTYNDELLSSTHIYNERVVGVMFPKMVKINHNEDYENFSGTHFAVIVTPLKEKAKNGSDEIEKAFDECWLGSERALAFQGWVRDGKGNLKSEIFTADLPKDLTIANDIPLEGTETKMPAVPKGVLIKRVTDTPKGISTFRHWLRSSPDGELIYFLMEDSAGITNIFSVDRRKHSIKQITSHTSSIHSPFNISAQGDQLVYFCNHSLIVYNLLKHEEIKLITNNKELYGIPNFDKTGQIILYNQYVKENSTSKFLQIFKIEL